MSFSIKKLIGDTAELLRRSDPDLRVDELNDGSAAILTWTALPFGEPEAAELNIGIGPGGEGFYLVQIMTNLLKFAPSPVPEDFYKSISDINNRFTCGSLICDLTPKDSDPSFYYNFGFILDAQQEESDALLILSDSLDNAVSEFTDSALTELLERYYKEKQGGAR